MATLVSKATGNFTASTTWYLGAQVLDSQAGNTNLTTSYVASSAFTPGAITVDGICVKVANRPGTTGTFSVELYNSTAGASVAGTEVTIDVDDVNAGDTAANNGCGWFYMKFGSPVTLLAATNYQVRAKASNSTQVALFRDGTAGNWSRVLVTTTEQAPAAADVLIITASYTSANSRSDYTITMNETATTDYGQIYICQGGTLDAATSASTNYNLKTSGIMRIWGTVNFATPSATMPDTSSLTVNLDCTSAGEFGIEIQNGGTLRGGGAFKTAHVKLGADASAGATSITLDQVPTNWDNGDTLVIGTTSRTRTETETKALTADVSTTTASISALTNGHAGNSGIGYAHISNLTRNVKIDGTNSTNPAYILVRAGATLDLEDVEMKYLGTNTSNKRGIDIQTTSSGSVSVVNCVMAYSSVVASSMAFYVSGAASNNFTIQNCTTYNYLSSGFNLSAATSGTNWTVDNCRFYNGGGTNVNVLDVGGTFTNNVSIGAGGTGIVLSDGNPTGTISNLEAQGGASVGLAISNYAGYWYINGALVWRNSSTGVNFGSTSRISDLQLILKDLTCYGNNGVNVNMAATLAGDLQLVNPNIYAGTTLAATEGIRISSTVNKLQIFGGAIGVTSTHSTADIVCVTNVIPDVSLMDVELGSTVEIGSQTLLPEAPDYYGIKVMNHDGTSLNHRRYTCVGNVIRDTTTLSSISLSERMTPTNANVKLRSSPKQVVVSNGQAVTISVKVRKSVIGDGTAYNGAQPRLILRRNDSVGITADTVIDTATASADGAYETLTGTTSAVTADGVLEFYVDCSATTGWVNLYDWSSNVNNDPDTTGYWSDGVAYMGAEYSSGSGVSGGTFISVG